MARIHSAGSQKSTFPPQRPSLLFIVLLCLMAALGAAGAVLTLATGGATSTLVLQLLLLGVCGTGAALAVGERRRFRATQ